MIVLTRTGRRDQRIAGVFANMYRATQAAHRYIAQHERDNYHRYDVHHVEIDCAADWYVAGPEAEGPTLGDPAITMMRSLDTDSVLYVFHKTGNVAHLPI